MSADSPVSGANEPNDSDESADEYPSKHDGLPRLPLRAHPLPAVMARGSCLIYGDRVYIVEHKVKSGEYCVVLWRYSMRQLLERPTDSSFVVTKVVFRGDQIMEWQLTPGGEFVVILTRRRRHLHVFEAMTLERLASTPRTIPFNKGPVESKARTLSILPFPKHVLVAARHVPARLEAPEDGLLLYDLQSMTLQCAVRVAYINGRGFRMRGGPCVLRGICADARAVYMSMWESDGNSMYRMELPKAILACLAGQTPPHGESVDAEAVVDEETSISELFWITDINLPTVPLGATRLFANMRTKHVIITPRHTDVACPDCFPVEPPPLPSTRRGPGLARRLAASDRMPPYGRLVWSPPDSQLYIFPKDGTLLSTTVRVHEDRWHPACFRGGCVAFRARVRTVLGLRVLSESVLSRGGEDQGATRGAFIVEWARLPIEVLELVIACLWVDELRWERT